MYYKITQLLLGKTDKISLIIFPLVFLIFSNKILESIYKTKKTNQNKKDNNDRKSVMYLAILIFFVLTVICSIPIIKNILFFCDSLFLIYIIVICPLINVDFGLDIKNENDSISSFLLLQLCYYITYTKEFIPFENTQSNLIESLQITSMSILIFLTIYITLLNMYYILYYIDKLYLQKYKKISEKVIKKIEEKYNIEKHIDIIKKDYKWKEILTFFKNTLYIIVLIILYIVLSPTLLMIIFFIDIIERIFTEKNSLYTISKLSLIITLFIVYILIRLSGSFNEGIISIYELFTSTIVIPIIIEKLLNNQKKISIN